VIEGCIPSSMASADTIEEERRLLYVAMTRAKDVLELVVPQQSMLWKPDAGDGNPLAQVSRFVPTSIRDKFETRRRAPKTSDHNATHPRTGCGPRRPSRQNVEIASLTSDGNTPVTPRQPPRRYLFRPFTYQFLE
jgi:ATP-dependent exoDNAse (exonuclease V) beta subunit